LAPISGERKLLAERKLDVWLKGEFWFRWEVERFGKDV
jgi:hypothetical protein